MIRAVKGPRTSTAKERAAIADGFVMAESQRMQRRILTISDLPAISGVILWTLTAVPEDLTRRMA